MKYMHNIYIANSYRYGDRIAYDLVIPVDEMNKEFDDEQQQDSIQKFLVGLYGEVGKDTLLTNHILITDSNKWESVVAKDSFFSDLKLIKNKDNFIGYLKINKILTKYDVMSLVAILLMSNTVEKVDLEKFVDTMQTKYQKKYNYNLYEIMKGDNRKLLKGDTLKKCSNIVFDKVLTSEDGFQKFDFILKEVRKLVGMPLLVG